MTEINEAELRRLADWCKTLVEPGDLRVGPNMMLEALDQSADAILALLDALAAARAREEEGERRNVDLSMLAYQWMTAHDFLKAGRTYDHPSPADVPNSIARANVLQARLDEAEGRVTRLADWIEHEAASELPYAEGEEDARAFLAK